MHVIQEALRKINLQVTIVALCILGVCVGTQQIQTVAWNTGIIEFSRDSLGVLMALILFTHYRWGDFVKYKVPYLVWSILALLASLVSIPIAFQRRDNFLRADTMIIALGIFLMGYCVIHTFISFFIEKYRPRLYLPLFLLWVAMMVLMIFSKSDYLWPECYFVLFLCFYLTPQTAVQRRNVTMGLVNGLILSFVLIQGHSMLFRPYDKVRYQGNFCNPNNNCIFLCLCLSAILAKILFLTYENKKKPLRIFFFLLAGSCYSFICMTIGRSGYLAAVVVTVFFLIAYCRIRKKKLFIRMGMLLVLLFAAMLPVTYAAVRYIPTIHPHVLFYYQEGYSESFVHSWDEWDSEKYITFPQMLEGIFGRFGTLKDSYDSLQEENSDAEVPANTMIASAAGEKKAAGLPSSMLFANAGADRIAEAAGSPKIPVLSQDEMENSLLVRYTIYKWFFDHLSLRGMPYAEQGFQLAEGYWVQHAHSIYLNYGINFGFPVMILFAVFIWWGIGRMFWRGFKAVDLERFACVLIALVPPVFGIFEFAWGTGMISTVALYLTFKEIVNA